jgi:hypothetical protein
MRAILVGSGILLLGWSDAVSQTPAVSPVAAAIEKYVLETEYPEEFDDVLYRVRAENLVIADIDGDGRQGPSRTTFRTIANRRRLSSIRLLAT